MKHIGRFVFLLGTLMGWMHASVFIYAPGVAPPIRVSYVWVVQQACTALRNLEVFSQDAHLDIHIDDPRRIGVVYDEAMDHIVYIPLFSDYGKGEHVDAGHLAQGQDMADLLYTYAYAAYHHDAPIHCIGHSRGAGTIATCMGLLWHDPAYLEQCIYDCWSASRSSLLPAESTLTEALGLQLGALCLMGTFDNLSETIANILDALALPRMVRRKLAKDPHYLYQQINYIVPLPYYDWNNPYTPRTVIHDIPAHIPCIFLHAQQDGMNPVAVAEDLSAQRAVIAPQRTHVWMPENSYLCSAMRYVGGVSLPHIEFPQLRSLPEANASLHHGIADREEAYTHQHLV